MIAPFSSDIGVTAFESSAYGKCSCASRYVESTNGFLSLPGTPTKRPLPLRIVNCPASSDRRSACEHVREENGGKRREKKREKEEKTRITRLVKSLVWEACT